jgi:hypothetical protein
MLSEDEYNSLLWVKEHYGTENMLMTPPEIAYAVYPVSLNKVVALPPSNLGYGDISLLTLLYDDKFYCVSKKDMVLKYTTSNIVLSRIPLNCDFLLLVEHHNREMYIYMVR